MPAKEDSREAVYTAIEALAKNAADFSGGTQAEMVREAALAWRALAGGQQPGRTAGTK